MDQNKIININIFKWIFLFKDPLNVNFIKYSSYKLLIVVLIFVSTLCEFFSLIVTGGFYWSLSDSKSPQLYITLLRTSWRVRFFLYCPSHFSQFSGTVPMAQARFHYFFSFKSSSHQRQLMIFHWSLSDNKSPSVSRALLNILADPNNAVVWMLSTRPLISKSFSSRTSPLVNVPSTPITIGITFTFLFQSFFSSLVRSRFLILLSISFSFTLWSATTAKSTIPQVLFFITSSGHLAEIRSSVCISKSQRI